MSGVFNYKIGDTTLVKFVHNVVLENCVAADEIERWKSEGWSYDGAKPDEIFKSASVFTFSKIVHQKADIPLTPDQVQAKKDSRCIIM